MSLLKPRILSPAQLAASRANALKSTGPKTARGKAQSRLNALRTGRHSPTYLNLFDVLMDAPPGAICRTAVAALSPEEARHDVFAELVAIFQKADIETSQSFARSHAWLEAQKKKAGRRPLSKPATS